MDDWESEHVGRWNEHRVQLPIGPLFCILAGSTRGPGWGAAAVRAAPAPARARNRNGARRDPVADYPEAARASAPRDHVDLPPRNRHARDRGHGAPPPATR